MSIGLRLITNITSNNPHIDNYLLQMMDSDITEINASEIINIENKNTDSDLIDPDLTDSDSDLTELMDINKFVRRNLKQHIRINYN